VWNHPFVLGGTTGNPVKLGLGDFQLAVVQWPHGLDRALAKGLGANHQAAAIILNSASENFRGGGAHTVDQNHQRAVVDHGRVLVFQYLNIVVGVADLDGGAFVDKQANQVVGFVQRATAVVAKIHDHAIHAVGLEFFNQFTHIAGSAFVVGIASLHGLEIGVKGGDVDDPDTIGLAVSIQFNHVFAGALFLQLHLISLDGDGSRDGLVTGVGRDHFQCHGGIARAADQVHHLVQAPADHVYGLFIALGNRDDAVGRLQLTLLGGRATGYQTHYLGVLVVGLQYRADALQREAHVDIEVLGGTGRKVGGVRVPHTGKGIHVSLECIFAAGLVSAFERALRAAAQYFLNRVIVCVVQSLGPNGVFNALGPEFVQSGLICLPGRLETVDANLVIGSE